MSDLTPPTNATQTAEETDSAQMGTFDESGAYTPRQVVSDDLGTTSFEDAIAGTIVEFDDGDIVSGTVVKVDKDEVLLDIGFKSEGVIPARELSIRHDVDPNDVVKLGDKIEALVLQKEDKEGRLVLSKKRAQYERAWGTIEGVKERNGTVRGPVIEVVKGGLILDIGLRGFLPASLVELRRVRDLQPYVGRELEAKIIELDKNRNNVVLSRRAYLEEAQRSQRDEFLTNLKPGEVRKGVVSSVVNFGAFVDLGGMDGLIHVSELSWKHVDHPGQVVQVGDHVTVRVLDVDLDRERISLSLKATQADPWQEFANAHRVGELVYGRVTKLVPFGAFVQVGDGIEGLVHISEMAVHHVDQPDQVVTPGEELWVKIIDIDLGRRRISLSIKQAAEGGEVAAEYREAFGEHAYDEHGNYIGAGYTAFEPESEAQAAWAGYLEEQAKAQHGAEGTTSTAADTADAAVTQAAADLVDEELVSEATSIVKVAAAVEAAAAAEIALAEEAALDDEVVALGVAAIEEAALEEDSAAAEEPASAEEPAATEVPAATPPPATAKAQAPVSEESPGAPPAR
jgi:small subunit ribosomal protein S1